MQALSGIPMLIGLRKSTVILFLDLSSSLATEQSPGARRSNPLLPYQARNLNTWPSHMLLKMLSGIGSFIRNSIFYFHLSKHLPLSFATIKVQLSYRRTPLFICEQSISTLASISSVKRSLKVTSTFL